MPNPIFVCLFVFTVGSLASIIQVQKDVDEGGTLDSNAENLGKRVSVRSVAQGDASTITKRDVWKHNSDLYWHKVNYRPVCFGARDNQYGSFSVPYGGKIAAVKLIRLSGFVSCSTGTFSHWSFWGCGSLGSVRNHVNVVITTSSNHIILPPSQFFRDGAGKWSRIPGYYSTSSKIVLQSLSPYSVSSGQQLRLWYGEDLVGYTESDNGGIVCCDVYALYV